MELLRSLPPNCNRSLKCQAVKNLYKKVSEKNINESKQESEELSMLWQCAHSEDEILSFLSFEAISNLVKLDKLPASQMIQKIIDSFKISKSKIECLNTLKNILLFVNVPKFKVTTTNLGLTHPFNAVLSSDVTSVLLFVPVLKDFFNNYNLQSDDFYNLMDPFFKYVFIQTRNSNVSAPLRQTIVNALLQDGNNLNYLFNILRWMQIEDNQIEFVEYLDLLMRKENVAEEVLRLILCVYWSFASSMQNTLLDFILKIIRINTNLAENDLLISYCLANLMNLSDLSRTYEILFLIVKKHQFLKDKHHMSMFILPLLQLVVNSDQKAAYLFSVINENLQSNFINNHKILKTFQISSSNTLMFLCERVLQHPDTLNGWLRNSSINSSLSSSTYELAHLIGGIIHMSNSSDVLQMSIKALQKMCTNNPHLSIELFPLLMAKLKTLKEPEQCLIILKSLPTISTNKVSTSMTLNFLVSSGSLSSTSTNLILALWKNHDDCFSHLIGRLQDCKSSPNEMALTQAGCLRDICMLNASKHGKECVGMLFQLLERKNDRPVRILCMQAIYHLCLEKVLNFQSFWLYFQSNLKQLLLVTAKEVRAILKVCHVLSHVTPGSNSGDQVNEVISYLWELLSHSNINKCVVDEIFNTLSQFPRSLFVLSQLPEDVTSNQMMKMEEKEIEDREVIYGDTYMTLIGKFYSGEVHHGLSQFFGKLMDEELLSLPRGIFFKHKEMIRLSFVYQLKMDQDHIREVDLKLSKLATTCLYLPTNSLLKSCFEYIINFMKSGMPEANVPVLRMILISLTKNSTKHLIPPFNWIFILRPILLHFTENIDEETVELCYKLVFNQSVQYSVMGHLLLQLIQSSDFEEIWAVGQRLILKNFSDLLTICTVGDISSNFKKYVFPLMDGLMEGDGSMADLVLSLREFASSEVALKESQNCVWEIFSTLVDKMKVEQHKEIEALIERCPRVVVDRLLLITDDCRDMKKFLLIRSSIINERSISFINNNIEAFVKINSTEVDKCFALVLKLIVFKSFHGNPAMTLRQWMTELIGFIKFSTKQSISDEAADWLVVVWFASIIEWSNSGLVELLYFPMDINYNIVMKFAMETDYNEFIYNIINILPRSLCQLLSNAEWGIVAEKVLDLLYHLLSINVGLHSLICDAIKESLRLLKSLETCKNPSFWMNFAELLDFRRP